MLDAAKPRKGTIAALFVKLRTTLLVLALYGDYRHATSCVSFMHLLPMRQRRRAPVALHGTTVPPSTGVDSQATPLDTVS